MKNSQPKATINAKKYGVKFRSQKNIPQEAHFNTVSDLWTPRPPIPIALDLKGGI